MKQLIENIIKQYVKNYQAEHNCRTGWEEPLIAYAAADDPLFRQLKKDVGPTHALPEDLLRDAKTVIAYFLPFERQLTGSNYGGGESSPQWADAYIETNRLIKNLNEHLIKELNELGFEGILLPATHNFDQERLISDWSHKHVAFIAGLGRFGLHRMLITAKGCCGRLGSVVTNLELPPSPRSNSEFCLYKDNQTCKRCVEQCINGALTVESFDRHKCYESCLANAELYSQKGLADVCGKCVSNVPCSFQNPVEEK